jgi:hypothetical protein
VPAASALILAGLELLSGTLLLMWMTMLSFREISRGHYRATTWVLTPLMALIVLVLPAGLRGLGWLTVGSMAAFLISVYLQRPLVEWLTGGLASAAGATLAGLAGFQGCGGCVEGAVQALAGAFFLGAVTHGMLLGHWYLNQPRLPMAPLAGATRLIFMSIAVVAAGGLALRPTLVAGEVPSAVVAFSASSYWWVWLALVAACAGLTVMIRSTVRSGSNQSATGLLYVAMIPAIGAQFVLDLLMAV